MAITYRLTCALLFMSLTYGKEAFFDAVPKELRCSGCEITVKVLDRMMRSPSKSLGKHVDEVIASVCDEQRFQISEYKPSTMLKVCNFIKDYHGSELHAELMKYYAHPKRSTYFEFGQHFCIDVLKMCAAVSHKSTNEGNSSLHFDSKTHDFLLKSGENVKVARPVREASHDEL
ncbi:hypothetical protein PoB_003084400 [Plakobranchus ocellatus]|uniref:Saposin B-type domain-containing protein n=1 Tax=Plakobranchus ocellatus TaxID=259542 RepID=A0AAV4A9J0_9GAST|nr:hypothetical protein PoB_003084400 [Plakobranchus ocellatus]